MPERLNHAAVKLALHREPVERQSAVLHLHHFDGPDFTGLYVHLNFSEADAMDTAALEVLAPFPWAVTPAAGSAHRLVST